MFHVLHTDNQSTQAMLHAWRHWGDANAPAETDTPFRVIHWLFGALLTVVTLWAGAGDHCAEMIWWSSPVRIVIVMLLLSPMCHLHYFCLTLPLVLGLLQNAWEDRDDLVLPTRLKVLFGIHIAGSAFPLIFEQYRNLGFAPLTTLPLWCEAIRVLRNGRWPVSSILPSFTTSRRKAA